MSNNKINTITPVSLSILKASGKLVENAESQIMMKDGPSKCTEYYISISVQYNISILLFYYIIIKLGIKKNSLSRYESLY